MCAVSFGAHGCFLRLYTHKFSTEPNMEKALRLYGGNIYVLSNEDPVSPSKSTNSNIMRQSEEMAPEGGHGAIAS